MCRLNIMTRLFLFFTTILVIVSCNSIKKEETVFSPSKMLDLSVEKIKKSSIELTNSSEYLRNIPEGNTAWKVVGVKDWCSGFWPGVLWYAYEFSGDELLREEAERFTAPIKEIAYTPALSRYRFSSLL